MPEFPLLIGGNDIDTVGEATADSGGTGVTPNATANTKTTSWVEIVSSTPIEAQGFVVSLRPNQTNLVDYLVDIAMGAAGSEVLLAENLHVAGRSNKSNYLFHVPIPAGSRLSAKSQADGASGTAIDVTVILIGASFQQTQELAGITTYGADTADSGGVGVDPGGTANTKGAWSEVVASTTNIIRQLLIAFGSRGNGAMTTADWLIDIAVGASTAEKIVVPDIHLSGHTTNDEICPPVVGPIPVNIPTGSRIAARAQCSIIDATDRLIDVIAYGVD